MKEILVKAPRVSICLLLLLVVSSLVLAHCYSVTNSAALLGCVNLNIFFILSIIANILTRHLETLEPSSGFTFGYTRMEVVFMFMTTILTQFGSLSVLKESIERIISPQGVHVGRLFIGGLFSYLIHLSAIFLENNQPLDQLIDASSSSWLQDHSSDFSQCVCEVFPWLNKFLLPRINPLILLSTFCFVIINLIYLFIEFNSIYCMDTIGSIVIAIIIFATMLPMSVYSGKILLQTMPSVITSQLDKCLREALTIDGVLEFRSEQFWSLSFTQMAGTLHVRIRRDANDQIVLNRIYDKLKGIVPVLTVQIFKDDWNRPSGIKYLFQDSVSINMPALSSDVKILSVHNGKS